MKNNLITIVLVLILTHTTATSYISNCAAQTNPTQSTIISNQSSSSSNISWFQPDLWPDNNKKRQMLEHCAELLRSAIDTNQIEHIKQACNRLTNHLDAVAGFKLISDEAISNLFVTAALLSSSKLNTTSWNGGYTADIRNPTDAAEVFYYVFSSQSGPIGQLEIDSNDGKRVLARALFFEDGKLKSFEKFDPIDEILAFKQNGTLAAYSMTTATNSVMSMTNYLVEESLEYDAMTNLVVRHRTWKISTPK